MRRVKNIARRNPKNAEGVWSTDSIVWNRPGASRARIDPMVALRDE